MRIIETNHIKSKVSDLRESAFNENIFIQDRIDFDNHVEEAGLIDAYEKLEGKEPERVRPKEFSMTEKACAYTDYFCEKACYLPVQGDAFSVIYPLAAGSYILKGMSSKDYLPLEDNIYLNYNALKDPENFYNNLSRYYTDKKYSNEVCPFEGGLRPYSSEIHNEITDPSECWSNYGPFTEEVEVEPFRITIVRSNDGHTVGPSSNETLFSYDFEVKNDAFYNFSFYLRTTNGKTFIRGPRFINKDIYTPTGGNLVVFTDQELEQADGFFEVNEKWHRYSTIAQLKQGVYKAVFSWPEKLIDDQKQSREGIKLKVAGVLLSKSSKEIPYDARYITKPSETTVYSPLLFDFANFRNPEGTSAIGGNSDWTIAYRKYIEDDPVTGNSHTDILGPYTFGFKNGGLVLNDTPVNTTGDLSLFYNTWTTNIIQYKKSTNTIEISCYNEKGDSYLITIDGVTYPLNKILEEEDVPEGTGISYQLQLGGENPTTLSGDIYRDLIFIPFTADKNRILQDNIAASHIKKTMLPVSETGVMVRFNRIEVGEDIRS